MTFHQFDLLRYFTFKLFADAAITHAVFTRHGGVSPKPWDSLNMGATVGDDLARVTANRVSSFLSVGLAPKSLFDVWQIHSAEVVVADAPRPVDQPYLKADAILTNKKNVSLYMRFADCVPILLHDPVRKVIGLVHSGWQGTVKKVAQAAVIKMQTHYGSAPENILAAIGPSIGAHHYQVGTEVVEQVRAAFGKQANNLLINLDGARQFNLWAANQLILKQSGVKNIEIAGICTACHTDDWFSHRAEHGVTGRFGVLIALNEG
jgi:YfiH family protein